MGLLLTVTNMLNATTSDNTERLISSNYGLAILKDHEAEKKTSFT
jgi:hypothetical protein